MNNRIKKQQNNMKIVAWLKEFTFLGNDIVIKMLL